MHFGYSVKQKEEQVSFIVVIPKGDGPYENLMDPGNARELAQQLLSAADAAEKLRGR